MNKALSAPYGATVTVRREDLESIRASVSAAIDCCGCRGAEDAYEDLSAILDVRPVAAPDTTDADIAAAEERVALYDDDPRQDIKTDVMNAFYAGASFARGLSQPTVTK